MANEIATYQDIYLQTKYLIKVLTLQFAGQPWLVASNSQRTLQGCTVMGT